MARLVLVLDVDVDAALVDPMVVAEDVVSVYEDEGTHGDTVTHVTELVGAEWRRS